MNAHNRKLLSEAARFAAKPLPPARRPVDGARARIAVRHLVLPGHEVARAEPLDRETIASFLKRTGWATWTKATGFAFRLPTICVVNGEPLYRRTWARRRIKAGDEVVFLSRPFGGNGQSGSKQVIGLVALVAIAALAIWVTGGAAAPLLGQAFASGTFAAGALGAAIGIGGLLLTNVLSRPSALDGPSGKFPRGGRSRA